MFVKFSELKKLESDVVTTISTLGAFGKLTELQQAAIASRGQHGPRAGVDIHLKFTLPTRIRETRGRTVIRSFHVGCFAKAEGDEICQLTYSVMIGENESPSMDVARKFHFDFEPVRYRNQGEPKPTFHFQLCGELSQHHKAAGYTDHHIAHLLPSWSQPRVPSLPMSLALVLNWLFIEFGHDPRVSAVRHDPRWRALVRRSEVEVIKPYLDNCAQFFTAANADNSFFSKQVYQES